MPILAYVILFGILASALFIITSWVITKSGRNEQRVFRSLVILTGIIFLGGIVIVLPFVDQPRLANIYLQFGIGIPMAILGFLFRIYPLIWFKRMKTRPDLVVPSKLITSGPYRLVRHPQYVAGIFFIVGWFVIWGGIFCFYLLPVLILSILFQAYIEERYILEKEFGDAYIEYKRKVGMFLPKIWKKNQ